jgi:predicted cupin superfamily sugar epimerase
VTDRAGEIASALRLTPHPEGGLFREAFRSSRILLLPEGERSALTTIYFLLRAGERSRWHRVSHDEVWHFLEGDPLELWITADLQRVEQRLLSPVAGPGEPVAVVPAGAWQAARPTGAFALVGCTVGPGFDFADWALLRDHSGEAARLHQRFPELAEHL